MGIFLVFTLGLCISILVVLIAGCLTKCVSGLKKFYELIRYKLFWNSVIRYIIQASLKMQISAAAVVALYFT